MSQDEDGENVEFDSPGDPGSDISGAEFDSSSGPDSIPDADLDEEGEEEVDPDLIEFDGEDIYFEPEPPSKENETDPSLLGENKEKKSKENIEYEVIHEKKLYSSIREDVKELQKILSIDFFSCKEILRKFRWNRERAIENYFSIGMEKVFATTGLVCYLIFDKVPPSNGEDESKKEFECPICLDDIPSSELITISKCKHFVCKNCMFDFFKTIESERVSGMSKTIECPLPGCLARFHSGIVAHILKRKKKHLRKEIIRSYVMENKLVKYCPHPDCGEYVSKLRDEEVLITSRVTSLMIDCKCMNSYCFNCGNQEYHKPASCEHLKMFEVDQKEEEASHKWVELNTKPCPGCRLDINKDGGCKIMNCRVCGCTFCWLCMEKRVNHGHTCIFSSEAKAPVVPNMKTFRVQTRVNKNKKEVIMLDMTNFTDSLRKWKLMKDSLKKEKKNMYHISLFYKSHPQYETLLHSSNVLVKARMMMMNSIIYFYYEFDREIYKMKMISDQCEAELRKRNIRSFDEKTYNRLFEQKKKKKRQNVVSKKKREKQQKKKQLEEEMKKRREMDTKRFFEKRRRIKDRRKRLRTNRNLFTCFLEQLEENTERLSYHLSMDIRKIDKGKLSTVTKILEGLFGTVEREMHVFEKDVELEKDLFSMIKSNEEKEEKEGCEEEGEV